MSWEGLTQSTSFFQEYPTISLQNEVNAIIEAENENHPVDYLTLGGWMTANQNGEPANTNMPCE